MFSPETAWENMRRRSTKERTYSKVGEERNKPRITAPDLAPFQVGGSRVVSGNGFTAAAEDLSHNLRGI